MERTFEEWLERFKAKDFKASEAKAFVYAFSASTIQERMREIVCAMYASEREFCSFNNRQPHGVKLYNEDPVIDYDEVRYTNNITFEHTIALLDKEGRDALEFIFGEDFKHYITLKGMIRIGKVSCYIEEVQEKLNNFINAAILYQLVDCEGELLREVREDMLSSKFVGFESIANCITDRVNERLGVFFMHKGKEVDKQPLALYCENGYIKCGVLDTICICIDNLVAVVEKDVNSYIADLRVVPISDEQFGLKVSKAAAILGTAIDDATTNDAAAVTVSVAKDFFEDCVGVNRFNCPEDLTNERIKELAKTIDEPCYLVDSEGRYLCGAKLVNVQHGFGPRGHEEVHLFPWVITPDNSTVRICTNGGVKSAIFDINNFTILDDEAGWSPEAVLASLGLKADVLDLIPKASVDNCETAEEFKELLERLGCLK